MSRRQTLADANRALDVRRLQEQVALQKLQEQQRDLNEARAELERRAEIHAASEADWAAALARPSVDIGVIGLWRLNTDMTRGRVTTGEQAVADGEEALATHRQSWAAQLRLADAVGSVAAAAARSVRRAADERALQSAEDILRAWRPQA